MEVDVEDEEVEEAVPAATPEDPEEPSPFTCSKLSSSSSPPCALIALPSAQLWPWLLPNEHLELHLLCRTSTSFDHCARRSFLMWCHHRGGRVRALRRRNVTAHTRGRTALDLSATVDARVQTARASHARVQHPDVTRRFGLDRRRVRSRVRGSCRDWALCSSNTTIVIVFAHSTAVTRLRPCTRQRGRPCTRPTF